MNLVKKNIDNLASAQNTSFSKIASYSALAGAFLSLSPDVEAQCGSVDGANPTLDIDINNDGIPDLQINFSSFATSFYGSFATTFGPYQNLGPVTYFAPITNGPLGIYFTFGTPNYCSLFYVSSVPFNIPGTSSIYFKSYSNYFLSFSFAFATAVGLGGNQLLGLGSSLSVCNYVNNYGSSFSFISGNSYVASNGVRSFVFSSQYNIPAYGPADIVQTFTWPSCSIFTYNSTLMTFSSTLVPEGSTVANGYINFPGATGTFSYSSGPTTFSGTFSNVNQTSFMGVQFVDAAGETFNGWVEFSYDPASNSINCVNTGFNPCSIESVNAANGTADACPTQSDIVVGEQFVGVCPEPPVCEPNSPILVPNSTIGNIKQSKGQKN